MRIVCRQCCGPRHTVLRRLIRLRLGVRLRLCKRPSLPTLNLQRVFFSDEKVYKCEYLLSLSPFCVFLFSGATVALALPSTSTVATGSSFYQHVRRFDIFSRGVYTAVLRDMPEASVKGNASLCDFLVAPPDGSQLFRVLVGGNTSLYDFFASFAVAPISVQPTSHWIAAPLYLVTPRGLKPTRQTKHACMLSFSGQSDASLCHQKRKVFAFT